MIQVFVCLKTNKVHSNQLRTLQSTSTFDSDFQIIEANYGREKATVRLHDAINFLQRSAYDMELYAEKLEDAIDDNHRAQVINWAINHLVCNIFPNFRIDLLSSSQAQMNKTGMWADSLRKFI